MASLMTAWAERRCSGCAAAPIVKRLPAAGLPLRYLWQITIRPAGYPASVGYPKSRQRYFTDEVVLTTVVLPVPIARPLTV